MPFEGMSPAEVYDQEVVTGIFGEWTPALVALARPAAGERVLDLACGSGAVMREVAPLIGPTGSLVGVDLSGPMLEVARARGVPDGVPVELHQASAERLPLADADVDLVLCQQGLQFFPDKEGAAAEIARVLRPGGRVALSVWCGLDANPVQQAFNESLLRHTGAPIFAAPFSFGDASALRAVLNGNGLEQVTVDQQTRTAHFRSVQHFAEVHVVGAAAVIQAFAEMDAHERAKVIELSVIDVTAMADQFLDDDGFHIPMSSLVATARKKS